MQNARILQIVWFKPIDQILFYFINDMNSPANRTSHGQLYLKVCLALLSLLTTPTACLTLAADLSPRVLSEAPSRLAAAFIVDCKIYDAGKNCQYCVRDKYFLNGICIAVETANLISNCNIYNSASTCFTCDEGYYLSSDSKSCRLGNTASNCLTFATQTTCASCKPGSALQSGLCVAISNCNEISGNACISCVPGFYINNGVCARIETFIALAGCAQYNANSVCIRCATGRILQKTGTLVSCPAVTANGFWDISDPNCVDLQYNDSPVCSLCRQGFQFDANGLCVETQKTDTCMLYDPASTNACAICMSGFYMDAPGAACKANGNSTDLSGQKDPLSAFRMSLLANVLLLGVVLVQFR